jgi:hypothetical protein
MNNDTIYVMSYIDKEPKVALKKDVIDKTATSVLEIVSPAFYNKVKNGTIDEVNDLIDKILSSKFKIKASV